MLRPVTFTVVTSTRLELVFNKNVGNISTENFAISSVDGNISDLKITSIQVDEKKVTIKTRPQIAGNYYFLQMLDTDDYPFLSKNGSRLISDDVSRQVYFVGINNRNPVRDSIYQRASDVYTLKNSAIGDILDSVSGEIYNAQKTIGQVLSDNYISEQVEDELRIRASGATDRLANENAYKIDRVSTRPSFEGAKFKEIELSELYKDSVGGSFPKDPLSLQQEFVESEEITSFSEESSFKNFTITVSKKNVIALKKLTVIRSGDEADCDGNIGQDYNISLYKYSLKDNRYDQTFAFKNHGLNSSQIMISEFGNIEKLTQNDKVIVSYLYKNLSTNVDEDTVLVYNTEAIDNESVPSSSTRFFLKNAPIIDSYNEIPERGGVLFFKEDTSSANCFRRELVFNASKLPSLPGEYTVNYNTGEVIVVGAEEVGEGTGRELYSASYLHRNIFTRDLDYYILDNEVVANKDRDLVDSPVNISFSYEEIFVEGEDYIAPCHTEVIDEFVENRLTSSFSIETKNTPITNVFKIFNQTTGEIYNPLYFSNSEIFFSGRRSPEIRESFENARFSSVENEDLTQRGLFVVPCFEVEISSSLNNSFIKFSPGIPEDLIDTSDTTYFIRSYGLSGSDQLQDIEIRFFGEPNDSGLITHLGISETAQPPVVGEVVTIGPYAAVFSLENQMICSNSGDFTGSIFNSSVAFSNKNIFNTEKAYAELESSPSIIRLANDSYISEIAYDEGFYKNISNIRKSGDFLIDYKFGEIYVGLSDFDTIEFGSISYLYSKLDTLNKNIIAVTEVAKKALSSDDISDNIALYDKFNFDNNGINILDLESDISKYNEDTALDLNNDIQYTNLVLDDYSVVLKNKINIIRYLTLEDRLSGKNQTSYGDERFLEITSDDIGSDKYNLYNKKYNSFEKNVIDLKRYFETRVFEKDGAFKILVDDAEASAVYSITHDPTGEEIFDEKLNVLKISNLGVVGSGEVSGDYFAEIMSGVDLTAIIPGEDYLLDSGGARFEITSVDSFLSRIFITSPAQNASDKLLPENGYASIVKKATVDILDSGILITIPSDTFVSNYDLVTVTYITEDTPDPGDKVVASYEYGLLNIAYKYVYDDIVVSYEYGDNEIDWSVSGSLIEGQEYYVSYKFGALRDALKNNFGILTKIPYFQNFSLYTDREQYRSALKAVIKSFSSGPTVSSFENIVEAFTEITPEITETAMDSWILGRNYLEPEKIKIEGPIEFIGSRHREGIFAQDNTVITTPALSNLNLTEGTISAWVTPQWNGIDNDAEITISLKNFEDKRYIYRPGDDIFDINNNFSLFSKKDDFNIVDDSGLSITLDNSKITEQSGVEAKEFSVFYASKREDLFRRDLSFEGAFALRLSNIEIDFISKIKTLNFGKTAEKYGVFGSGIDYSIINDLSIGFASINDNYKSLFMPISLVPLLDDSEELPILFDLSKSDISKNLYSKYDRLHKTVSCSCSIKDTLSELSSFRDSAYNSIEIIFETEVTLADNLSQFNIISNNVNPFFFIDENKNIFKINAFIDSDLNKKENIIPNKILGISLDRFPINKKYTSSLGSNAVNSIEPSGIGAMCFSALSLLTQKDSLSDFFDYNEQSYILDFYSNEAKINFEKDQLKNTISVTINDAEIKAFYTDLISNENQFLKRLSEEASSPGIIFGTFNENVGTSIDITELDYFAKTRFNLDNIYIGKSGNPPRKNPFVISRKDSVEISSSPYFLGKKEGVYIWFDEFCGATSLDNHGQWIFRSYIQDGKSLPYDVFVSGDDYELLYEDVYISDSIEGSIVTDGEFSSVDRSHRLETLGECSEGPVCSANYRFCAEGPLEDVGWSKLNETSSDLINTLIGGSQNDRSLWALFGNLETSYSSGSYIVTSGDSESGAYAVTNMPCHNGDFDLTLAFEVLESSIPGISFDGEVSGQLSAITPIEIRNENFSVKLILGKTNSNNSCLIVLDSEANSIIDIAPFDWVGKKTTLVIRCVEETVTIEDFDKIISRISIKDFEKPNYDDCVKFSEPVIVTRVVDEEFTLSGNSDLNKNSIKISLIEYNSVDVGGSPMLEDDDVVISTDSKIEFLFRTKEKDGYIDGYDGYIDAYDGYISSPEVDVDEIRFSSDKLRYLFDSGESLSKNRISIFKDGKGFLNFRIYDNGFSSSARPQVYNIAKNIKDFKSGELHHIAASWRLNTLYEKDEMHLFVDGLEVPNLFRFGGKIKATINDKFSDIEKEILQNFKNDLIQYYPTVGDGTILAGTSVFYSDSFDFSDEMIGRSIIFTDSSIAEIYVGKKYVLGQKVGEGITILNADTFDPINFAVSASDISWNLAPAAGIKSEIKTDLINSKYSIFIKDCFSEEREVGGVFYEVNGGEITILNERSVKNPAYRVNLTLGIIEFVHENNLCQWEPSISVSDLEVHIKTFGLLFKGVNEIIEIPGSTYNTDIGSPDFEKYTGMGYDPTIGGKSIFMSHAVEPVSLGSVKITKILKDRFIPEVSVIDNGGYYEGLFYEDLSSSTLTSESALISKVNKGRYISIDVDSDNIVFCDENIDGYVSGYSSVTVYGKTLDGSDQETFTISKNGIIKGKKIFYSINSIEGSLNLVDPYYEPAVLKVLERDAITISNNNGDRAEIFEYFNGSFQISTYGTSGTFPFELTPGSYSISYPAFLNLKIPNVGEKLFFGTDMLGKNSFNSTIDDLKIITEMSSDTRPYELLTSGTRSVTRDFLSPNPSCSDDQTLLLTSFDDPIEIQARRLRQKEFLNSSLNFKFKLDEDSLTQLLPLVNKQEEFESQMIRMGFDYDDAKSTFVEAHNAYGGPVFNDARLIRSEDMLVSSMSVNEKFGLSRIFANNKPLILDNNKSFFRKNEGTIEFWISPILNTKNDFGDRYFVDIFSAERKRLKSSSSTEILLPNSASKIVGITLLTRNSIDQKYYSQKEEDSIIFDEIYRSDLTGVLEGGTGVSKDFSTGAQLSPDGKTILLKEALPSHNCDVLVTYVSANSSGERISVFKNSNSQIIFSISGERGTVYAGADVNWKRNTWHKIRCVWKANSKKDFIKIFVDGSAGKVVSYGDLGIVYGSGSFYGQSPGSKALSSSSKKITLKDDFRVICIGGSSINKSSALSRIDNVRFSRVARDNAKTSDGESIDLTYSENINSVLPVKSDDATTFIMNSSFESGEAEYAHIVDPKRGIFNFDIDVIDEFDLISSYETEDLIIDLVNTLKPSHANALVKFKRKICK